MPKQVKRANSAPKAAAMKKVIAKPKKAASAKATPAQKPANSNKPKWEAPKMKQIKIWNTRSECKHTVDKSQHEDAVSCVRFYHAKKPAICVTASWDKTIKVWKEDASATPETDPIRGWDRAKRARRF